MRNSEFGIRNDTRDWTNAMKNGSKKPTDDVRKEYDFRSGVRGKYAADYAKGRNVVLLAPDVAAYFPDSASVNEALRVLVRAAGKSVKS